MPTRIEEWNAAKRKLERLKVLLQRSRDGQWDKFGATVKVMDSYAGVYGSSTTSSWGDMEEKAVQEVLQDSLRPAIVIAVERAEQAVAEAARAAEAEAKAVLSMVATTP